MKRSSRLRMLMTALLAPCMVAPAVVPAVVQAAEPDDPVIASTAYRVWNVLHALGLPDVNIAGILANWQMESGLDATCIEGIYDEPGYLGIDKTRAARDLDAYCSDVLFPMYEGSVSISRTGYQAVDGYYPGLGLGQWTGPSARRLLQVASAAGKDWSDTDFQLAYAISDNYRPGFIRSWKTAEKDAPTAAMVFMVNWEGYTNTGSVTASRRKAAAATWLEKIKQYKFDQTSAERILDIASGLGISETALESVVITGSADGQDALVRALEDVKNDGSIDQIAAVCMKDAYDAGPEKDEMMLDWLQESEDFRYMGPLRGLDTASVLPGDIIMMGRKMAVYTGDPERPLAGVSDRYVKWVSTNLDQLQDEAGDDVVVFHHVDIKRTETESNKKA